MNMIQGILERLELIEKRLGIGIGEEWSHRIVEEAKKQVGTNRYRNGITKDGRLACAAFVSGVLRACGAMSTKIEYGQRNLERRLRKQGWIEVEEEMIRRGDLIFWNPYHGRTHGHVGILVNNGGTLTVIDNSSSKRVPVLRDKWPHSKRPIRCYLRKVK